MEQHGSVPQDSTVGSLDSVHRESATCTPSSRSATRHYGSGCLPRILLCKSTKHLHSKSRCSEHIDHSHTHQRDHRSRNSRHGGQHSPALEESRTPIRFACMPRCRRAASIPPSTPNHASVSPVASPTSLRIAHEAAICRDWCLLDVLEIKGAPHCANTISQAKVSGREGPKDMLHSSTIFSMTSMGRLQQRVPVRSSSRSRTESLRFPPSRVEPFGRVR